MRRSAAVVLISLLSGGTVDLVPALADPVAGRIVRVVYKVAFQGGGPQDATWGFHLAHMSDGQYCLRFGDPGRLALANIRRNHDMCFSGLPGRVERSAERAASPYEPDGQGDAAEVTTFQKGSIARAGNDIILDIDFCAQMQKEANPRCFPNRYIVHMHGEACAAEIILSSSSARAIDPTCEHYKAE